MGKSKEGCTCCSVERRAAVFNANDRAEQVHPASSIAERPKGTRQAQVQEVTGMRT
jgi:hypothetical protein